MKRAGWLWLVAVLALALVGAGCGGGNEESSGGTGTSGGAKDKVTLQLKWVTQAQFAGYYAAKAEGYYDDEGLDVEIKTGGPDIVPEQVVLGGQAEFGIDWLDNLLATRDQNGDIVNIAQVFARSGMTEVTWKDSGLDSIASLKGKKVGVWLGGNEHKLFAALNKNGIDPQSDVEVVAQPFDMSLFLNREVDAAAAMTYNELAQVLEQENPDTGELYTLDDLNVLKMSDQGTGALEDGVFVRSDWIQDEGNQDIATRFLKASFKGWVFCRDNPDDCLQIVLDNGPTLGEGHQRDQQADLAERPRHRGHEPRRLRQHGADRHRLRRDQERGVERRLHRHVREGGGRGAQGRRRGRQRDGLAGADSGSDAGRRVARRNARSGRRRDTSAATRFNEGRERCPF
jgi:NitT/TauT family transport system substrate-binding protein